MINFKNNLVLVSDRIGIHIGILFARLVLEHRNQWHHSFIDDVSLGMLIGKRGYKIYNGIRSDVGINSHLDLSYYHYRVKDAGNRNNDISLMKSLYKKINKL